MITIDKGNNFIVRLMQAKYKHCVSVQNKDREQDMEICNIYIFDAVDLVMLVKCRHHDNEERTSRLRSLYLAFNWPV